MNYISHRGNLDGKSASENHPDQINRCLDLGFDVEIDTWYVDGEFYLGHDEPQYKVKFDFFLNKKLWVHCKNVAALAALKGPFYNINCFFIDRDDCVLTSKGNIWLSPTYKKSFKHAICVMPEDPRWEFEPEQLLDFSGICTDKIYYYTQYVANLRR